MPTSRRDFITLTAGALASVSGVLPAAEAIRKPQVKAVAFDAFPIFDPRPVFIMANQLFPGKGEELGNEWRTRQFEYTWLRVAAGRYADFWQVTQDALAFAAKKLKLELPANKREKLMQAYLELKAWPDVMPALQSLKRANLRLAFLSNFTTAMLDRCVRSAGLEGIFEQVLSTDQVKTYKPDPRAYQLGTETLKLNREEILFVEFAGWDAAGAKLFGYPTFWLNRLKLPMEELDVTPDAIGGTLTELIKYLM